MTGPAIRVCQPSRRPPTCNRATRGSGTSTRCRSTPGARRTARCASWSSLEQNPDNRELLTALATMYRDVGAPAIAVQYARRLVALFPEDPGLRQLLGSLESQR